MAQQSLGNRVQANLEQAVASGRLPDAAQQKAEQLLMRLQKPVRLGLLGMPGSGKSLLLNLLVGTDLVPAGLQLPTLQLLYGDTAQANCTLADGSKKTVMGSDLRAIAALSPVYVEMQMPLPALRKISMLEIVAPNDMNAVHKASHWAAKRSDVLLWCTKAYDDTEQRIWGTMPDLSKDHAFCMLTHADVLFDDGTLDDTIAAVEADAKHDFNDVLPIATPDALDARRSDGTVDKEMMRDSGGSALISAVLKQVEHGRQSAVDMADVLLHQHADALAGRQAKPIARSAEEAGPLPPLKMTKPISRPTPPTPDRAAKPPPDATKILRQPTAQMPPPKADTPKEPPSPSTQDAIARLRKLAGRNVSKVLSDDAATPADSAQVQAPPPEPKAPIVPGRPVSRPLSRTASKPLSKPDPAAAPVPPSHPHGPAVSNVTRLAYDEVLKVTDDCGRKLTAVLKSDAADADDEIMRMTTDHIQWLCDYLNDNGDDADPPLKRARDTGFDAADMVQLMQLEKGDAAALEAVTLLLQIKRELQTDLAA